MGKFPWTQGHPKQPSEKYTPSHEWFTKSNTEPSRQAVNEVVKEHITIELDSLQAQTASRMRSRSGTLSSMRSHRAKSSSDRSAEIKSRPQSRQSVIEDGPPSPTRVEPVSRSLFSKGSRIMRRKTSRLTLLPSQIEELSVEGRHRDPDTSKLDFAAQLLNLSLKRTHSKPNISGPFGFQHVTHTNQGQFRSLNSTTRTELVSEFSALQACQEPAAEIKGISVDDLPASPEAGVSPDASPQPSPTSSIMPDLPMTPPRPEPPPKDDPRPVVTPNIRLSRSVENFSRPTRSPGFNIDISPISEVPRNVDTGLSDPLPPSVPPSPLSWAEATTDTLTNISSRRQSVAPAHLLDKPLPLPPTVVHAVSTSDDSALPLRTAPLPQLPPVATAAAEETAAGDASQSTEPRPSTPHRASLRHMQTFPSSKAARRRSQSSGEMTLGSAAIASAFASPVVSQMPKPKRRTSIGVKKIDIEDWEDAIDYSWDHPPDLDDDFDAGFDQAEAVNPHTIIRRSTRINSTQGQMNRPMPLTLTPVMEQEPLQDPQGEVQLQSPTTGYGDKASAITSLQGLGIETFRPATAMQVEMDSVSDRSNKRESPGIRPIRREPGSPISKSSSQESIILSIASSIMGTHRSSNSSTSLSDMSHLASIEDEANLVTDDAMRRADSIEGNSSDSSQETVTTEPKSVSTPATELPSPPVSQNPSPAHKHERGTSLSRVSVPNRTSSIAAAKSMPQAARQRSSTLNGRPRNVRVSYSLFPAPRPAPA